MLEEMGKPLRPNVNLVNCPPRKRQLPEVYNHEGLLQKTAQLRHDNEKLKVSIKAEFNSNDVEEVIMDVFSEVKKLITENQRLFAELKELKIYHRFLTDELEKLLGETI